MTDEHCARGTSFADLVDYWAGETDGEQLARLEEHVFECAECAERLADIETIARGIAGVTRGARFHGIVTDSILNRFARDGLRIRTFAPEAGKTTPCAVWADDDLVVSRLRADFTGFEHVTLVLELETGEELSRVSEIPVPRGSGEIIDAFSADELRKLPSIRLRLVLSGSRAGQEQTIGEYGLEHAGSMTR